MKRLVAAASALLVLLVPVLSGCGLGTSGGFVPTGALQGPLSEVKNLDGLKIAIGSKSFQEQLILGKIAAILMRSAGADVQDLTNMPGSDTSRQAMIQNQIQMAWEYTGTAWISYLGHDTGIPDKQQQYDAVRKEDAQKYGLIWLKPAPMNNSYGFAMTRKESDRLHVTKLSQVESLPVKERTFCVESEFANRNDGFEPMLKHYGIPLGSGVPRNNIRTLDTGAVYAATNKGDCRFGEIFTTDGRIKSLDLVVLQDDKRYFPAYNVAPVISKKVLDKYPQLRELLQPVSDKLTDEVLIELNAQVDVDGREPADVAMDWLVKEGFVSRD
ncbi:osmoprotectant transport system substrate-binding protein [Kribbella sp. VKM Ac-2569]|uniref:glycine betaine ABC transporter substrate-binding protein n=1 Tax=Kribbella sp. VKM Ac-2569 TaxID=2512220 RepID=UPI00102AB80A|nr:glycine betaine ABC transporter substrate-binding protein [Kribbella sp. VKM Ac-2569]RZT26809.1 osmoprotectant transport system substrate-binding protein [Kribbella sp. VKM Ac-2569]